MSRYTITPWRTHSDLLTVRSQLYCLDPTSGDFRAHAVSRILAWKLRGNLPHALESTALLIDAILHHHAGSGTNSLFSIRAVYAAAFTRFVTGFCDIGRNRERSLEPSSMLEIARQIDMPAEFVALRHEATHEELPSLQRLTGVTTEALEWLWTVYWSRLDDRVDAQATESENATVAVERVSEKARRVLREYRSQRRQALKGKWKGGDEAVQKAVSMLVQLCQNQPSAMEALARVMVEDKLLYPAERELEAPMHGAYLLWDALLLELSFRQPRFLSSLMDALFAAILKYGPNHSAEEDPSKEAVHLWLLHIACSDAWQQIRSTQSTGMSSWLMKQCCLQPGYWSYKIGQALLEEDDAQFVDAWSDLLQASAVGASEEDGMDVDAADGEAAHGPNEDLLANEEAEGQGWRIAIMPPSAPIGVV